MTMQRLILAPIAFTLVGIVLTAAIWTAMPWHESIEDL